MAFIGFEVDPAKAAGLPALGVDPIVEASVALAAEIGDQAAAGVVAEATITVQMKPYPRRILAVAQKTSGSA